MHTALGVCCCYAQRDNSFLKLLMTHLMPMQRQGIITIWSNADISPGTEWKKEIKERLDAAHIILLLISPDFIASDFCYSVEMQYILTKHYRGETRIIPIIVRPVAWEQASFGHLAALPKDGKPITRWTNRDEAFLDIIESLQSIFKSSTLIKNFQVPVSSDIGDLQTRPRILVIDDEEYIIEFIKLGFKYEGFQVEAVMDGLSGLDAARKNNPDLIILDVMLPNIDGFEVCRQLRSNPVTRDIPILMLSFLDAIPDRINGLDRGADDYVTKPFNFEELVARVRALLRRHSRSNSAQQNKEDNRYEFRVLQFGELCLDRITREVTRAGKQIELTATEFNLLHLLMLHPREVLSRQTILEQVWGYDFLGETNVIEVYIRFLREKIEDSAESPKFIQTVRGVGYVLKG